MVITPILFFLMIIILELTYRAYRTRLRNGLYKEYAENGCKVIQTDLCKIMFNPNNKYLILNLKGKEEIKIPYDEILGLHPHYSERKALLSEMLFEGFDIFSIISKKYRDAFVGYIITLSVKNKGNIPIFMAIQYEVRDFLDFITPVELFILSKLGFHRNIDEYGKMIFKKISSAFVDAGIPLDKSQAF